MNSNFHLKPFWNAYRLWFRLNLLDQTNLESHILFGIIIFSGLRNINTTRQFLGICSKPICILIDSTKAKITYIIGRILTGCLVEIIQMPYISTHRMIQHNVQNVENQFKCGYLLLEFEKLHSNPLALMTFSVTCITTDITIMA